MRNRSMFLCDKLHKTGQVSLLMKYHIRMQEKIYWTPRIICNRTLSPYGSEKKLKPVNLIFMKQVDENKMLFSTKRPDWKIMQKRDKVQVWNMLTNMTLI